MKKSILPLAICLILTGCRKFDLEEKALAGNTNAGKTKITDGIFCVIPATAEFPGGTAAWQQFLQQNLTYPETAIDADIQGTVIVQFVVDTDGSLSNIEAVSGPDELKECAVEVLKKSPDWIPAHINGRNIKDYRKQPIIFRLEDE